VERYHETAKEADKQEKQITAIASKGESIMGKYFSDVVDKAIEDIYYCYDSGRAAAVIEPLSEASNAGDGDAAYILSRCLSGPQYSWAYHPFPEDDAGVERLIKRSIRQGSAIGVLGAMRCGMLTPEMEEEMQRHFSSLQDVWNVVYEKAKAGSPFCQNMIGNTYFWLDIPRIEGKGPNDFPNQNAFMQYLHETELQCIPWFERAFQGGMGFAGRNLYNIYNDGDKDFDIVPQPEKAEAVAKLGASLGYPEWMETYGKILLQKKGREREGLDLSRQAVQKGQLSAWFYIGKAYQEGKAVPKDVNYAMECYEQGLADPHAVGCANRAGELYYLGKDGIAQDYARAVQLFERAHAEGSNWGDDMLGICYLLGQGCQKDPVKARAILEKALKSYTSGLIHYGLGLIYADGLGVPEDIKKGVEHLQKCKNYPPAQEALLRFKKTLFGKWVRR